MSDSDFSENDENGFTNDCNDEDMKDNIEFLIRNLGNNINTETFFNNNNLMSSISINSSKSKKSDNEDYLIQRK